MLMGSVLHLVVGHVRAIQFFFRLLISGGEVRHL